ncbi:adenylate/guanylate cyclase catalytic domain protein [Leptospira inadai serovar Lyme str. 10]|uniref:Adenylate/guanylate cyclase catalytic domain protein n=2 Tax=Leptospira inadai serovar Lyme TaxID=293084 RepID=V6HFF2_9LEPT|nr:peroxidase family protein [Leptospira inadai]EQA38358.1 adenylate/guanylate cyclase catalytic domain protein [Leptospira inadai serovar Lyme str. 10]PNV75204.1 guanylate cyclase [Leptospira inadai serovar Lyme]
MRIFFENDKEIKIENSDGLHSLLQISLAEGIPHVHACGGNARCSTCRVLVLEGADNLSARNEKESALAERKGFPENVRLACQSRVLGDIKVRRLIIDDADQTLASTVSNSVSGKEKAITILFSDIRGFTTFSESHLPYDVIHILNRYFYRMSDKILKYGGTIDKYIGDGLMAVFGLEESDPLKTNLSAIRSALEMQTELDDLNSYLRKHFNARFEIGVGIHYGTAILGQLGHPLRMSSTAIGDSVNQASRIESTTKKAGARLLISESVFTLVKDRVKKGRTFETTLKGKTGKYKVHEILGITRDCREEIAQEAKYRIWDSIDLSATGDWLTLAFHASFIFGSDGSWLGLDASIRFPSLLNDELNSRIRTLLNTLIRIHEELKRESEGLQESRIPSLSDLIAFAGALAVQKSGGPKIADFTARPDSEYPIGRLEYPPDNPDLSDSIRYYARMKFDTKEMVALFGAKTIGRHERGFYTDTPNVFDNNYFKDLLYDGGAKMTAPDRALLSSEETKRIVTEFALKEDDFFSAFEQAFVKLVQGRKVSEIS